MLNHLAVGAVTTLVNGISDRLDNRIAYNGMATLHMACSNCRDWKGHLQTRIHTARGSRVIPADWCQGGGFQHIFFVCICFKNKSFFEKNVVRLFFLKN